MGMLDYSAPSNYKAPMVPTNVPASPAQYSDFWKNRSYDGSGFANAATNYSDLGNQYLKRHLGDNPFGQGGFLSDPAAFQAQFGFKKLNPYDPDIPAWMQNLQGGSRNVIDENTRRMANAGIASGRSGMGVRGGVNPYALLQAQGIRQLAGQYGNDYRQAVEWTRQANADINANAGNMANLYGDLYRADLGAGQGLLGLQLQALQSGDDSKMRYLQMMREDYGKDTAGVNQLRGGEQAREAAYRQAFRADDQAAADRAQQLEQESYWRQHAFNPGRYAGAYSDRLQEYLQGTGYLNNATPIKRTLQSVGKIGGTSTPYPADNTGYGQTYERADYNPGSFMAQNQAYLDAYNRRRR